MQQSRLMINRLCILIVVTEPVRSCLSYMPPVALHVKPAAHIGEPLGPNDALSSVDMSTLPFAVAARYQVKQLDLQAGSSSSKKHHFPRGGGAAAVPHSESSL